MSDNMDHLVQEAEHTDNNDPDKLQTISTYATEYKNKLAEVKAMEEAITDKKRELLKIGQELLPEAMLSVDMKSFELASGETISIQEDLSCSVKDYGALYKFLEERGDDAIMKTSIELGKMPNNILKMVLVMLKDEFNIDAEARLYIHPSTLKAYFKRLCGVNGKTEAEVPLASIDNAMVSTYSYYKVSCK